MLKYDFKTEFLGGESNCYIVLDIGQIKTETVKSFLLLVVPVSCAPKNLY
jgi:hypothetical protein